MDLIDQILSQAKNFLICPVCNNNYNLDEIRFRGFIDNTYIFQAFCARDHEPLAVTYLASLHKLEKPIGAYFHALSGQQITKGMLEKAEKDIDQLEGDFEKLFEKLPNK